jgi:transposase-like protein
MTKGSYYTKEFKQEAIRLLESGDKSGAELARELGISDFSGSDQRKPLQVNQ